MPILFRCTCVISVIVLRRTEVCRVRATTYHHRLRLRLWICIWIWIVHVELGVTPQTVVYVVVVVVKVTAVVAGFSSIIACTTYVHGICV